MKTIKRLHYFFMIIALVMLCAGCKNQSDSEEKSSVVATKEIMSDNSMDGSQEETSNKFVDDSTEKSTEAETEKPTEVATEKPTEAETEKPTEAETEKPTEAATEKPTEAETEKPTEVATEKPTEAPIEKPTETPTVSEEEKIAMEIVESIITNDMSELEKVITIHDYISLNVEYDYENYRANTIPAIDCTALGALKYGLAVCDGYAHAFLLLCKCVGIDVARVIGDAYNGINTDEHAWNQVKINGIWYNVDVTWDDRGKEESADYKYFLVSDETLNKNHFPDYTNNSCPKDYDIKEIVECSLKNTKVKNVYYCTTEEQIIERINAVIETREKTCEVWMSGENLDEVAFSLTDENRRSTMIYKYGAFIDYLYSIDVRDGMRIYHIDISYLDSLPVVSTYEELVNTFNILYESDLEHKNSYYIMYVCDEFPEGIWEAAATDFDYFMIIADKPQYGDAVANKYKDKNFALLCEICIY